MKGNNTVNQPPVFGTKGVANAANKPGSLYEPGEWTDLQGNFWHFGGSDNTGFRSDLWKYDPLTNMWTWMKGSGLSNQSGIYGTIGIPAAANNPGGRIVPASWTDNSGNFWMFGGSGRDATGAAGSMNDLWKYDPVINQWTWMKGSNLINQAGVYGVKGIPSIANTPGARYETSCTWVDNAGNLWLFGGDGMNSGIRFNDLWKYDITTNQWTWMSGSNLTNQPGVYGTQGIPNSTNIPSARSVYTSWKDNNGDLWLFAGDQGGGGQPLNDLWKYTISTNEWTWVSGSNLPNQLGIYGTKCVPSTANSPGARSENRTRWTDDCGNFWTFGGFLTFNDLWRYNPVTNIWTWVSGANFKNQLGNYGVQGVATVTNIPGSRGGAVGWKDKNNNFWLFGGFENTLNNRLNDLWKYTPDKPTASFTFTPNNACGPANVSFSNSSVPNCNQIRYSNWNFGDPGSGINNTSSLTNPTHVFNNPGTYPVKLVVTSCTGSKDSITQTVTVISCGCSISAQTGLINGTTCNGGTNGSASVNISNGSGGIYTYNWSNGINGTTTGTVVPFTGLSASTYTVTVSDGVCSTTTTITITSPPPFVGQFVKGTANCSDCGCKEWITVTATGGTGPYNYLWSASGGYTKRYKNHLCPGAYNIQITDKNGCSTIITLTSP